MKIARLINCTLVLLSIALVGCEAEVEGEYPSRPITIVVPYAPGGGGDTFTRAIAVQAQEILAVKVLVENRTGGGATIGVGSVARSEPDGYTLGFVSSSPVVVVPNFFDVPFDPVTDLTYLSRFVVSPYPVLVLGDSPYDTFAELLEYGRANPGRLRWSTAGINGAPHIATEAALQQEGVQSAFVPMQGSTEVLAGLLGGTIEMGVMSDYAGALAAGDVKLLAEIGPDPIDDFPDIPTYKQMGYPLAPTIFFGFAGPSGLPDDVIAIWESTLQEIVNSDSFQEVARRLNGKVTYLGHKEFQALVLSDIESTKLALDSLGLLEE
jgi:tripartite-type tricarboxylate transporter receptor subunit TctC